MMLFIIVGGSRHKTGGCNREADWIVWIEFNDSYVESGGGR